MFVEPMKARAIDVLPSGPEYLMEIKLDGWRVIAGHSAASGQAWLETRTGNRIGSVGYINEAVRELTPPDTVLDGEIVDAAAPVERQWNRTQTILSRNAAHLPIKSDPMLTYVVFDVLVLGGVDLRSEPLHVRKDVLTRLLGRVSDDQPVQMGEWSETSEQVLDVYLDAGYEGVVVKRTDSRYAAGSRSGGWFKLKVDTEVEATVTGTYEPTAGSKYDGWAVGGITFEVRHPDGRVYNGRAAGMDDATRAALHDDPSWAVGRVVELAHMGIGETGALRHPRWKRLRDPADKNIADAHNIAKPARQGRRSARPDTSARVATPPPERTHARMRNYKQMTDEKLQRVHHELVHCGDAHQRCVNGGGSGDPRLDRALVERLLSERGLR